MRCLRTSLLAASCIGIFGGPLQATASEIQGNLFSLPSAPGGVQLLSGIEVVITGVVEDTTIAPLKSQLQFDDLSDPTSPRIGVTSATTRTGAFKIRIKDHNPSSMTPRLVTLNFGRSGSVVTQSLGSRPIALMDGQTYKIDLTVPEQPLVQPNPQQFFAQPQVCVPQPVCVRRHQAVKRFSFLHR